MTADPDTPTACETCGDAGWFTADPSDPEFCECEAGKRLMAANNADPDTPTADAPADTDLREQIAATLYNTEARRLGYDLTWKDCADPKRWLDAADALLPLVRAQVEAARRDALNEAADEWPAFQLKPSECRDLLRDRVARGETRQP